MHRVRPWPILAALLVSLVACTPSPVSPALQAHLDAHTKIRPKYFYQSIIRVANSDRNPGFDALIRDVRKVTAYLPPREDSTYTLSALRPGLREDGFETLLEARTADSQRLSLWVKTVDQQEHYLALVEAPEGQIILEVDGRLAIEHLTSLTGAEQASIRKLIMGEL
jgi:hypothetical protein